MTAQLRTTPRPTAVVTGATGGIGREVAGALARDGWTVVLAGRDERALASMADGLRRDGAVVVPRVTDVADPASVEALADAATALGGLRAWVNAAAVMSVTPAEAEPLADVRRILETDVLGVVHGTRAALARMQGGVVVNFSSLLGGVPAPFVTAYSAAKHAVRAYSAGVRSELWLARRRGVHVCTVLPAAVRTPIFRHAANRTGAGFRLLPPVADPERIAAVVLRLLERPRAETWVGAPGRLAELAHTLAPGLVERLSAALLEAYLDPGRRPATVAGNLHEPLPADGRAALEDDLVPPTALPAVLLDALRGLRDRRGT